MTEENIFQFQYGAIRGALPSKIPEIIDLFQFQYGAIRGRSIRKDS